MMEFRGFGTAVFSEETVYRWTHTSSDAKYFSLKKFRKSSHLETDTSEQEVGVEEVTEFNTLKLEDCNGNKPSGLIVFFILGDF